MMFDNWGYGGPGFFGMGFGMLLFWALLVVGVIVLLRWLSTGPDRRAPPAEGTSALDILAQRYARGEIDREEFEQKRHDLQKP
jgi:putative membrane protein